MPVPIVLVERRSGDCAQLDQPPLESIVSVFRDDIISGHHGGETPGLVISKVRESARSRTEAVEMAGLGIPDRLRRAVSGEGSELVAARRVLIRGLLSAALRQPVADAVIGVAQAAITARSAGQPVQRVVAEGLAGAGVHAVDD